MKGVADRGETEQTRPGTMGLAQMPAMVGKGHQPLDKSSGTYLSATSQCLLALPPT